MAIGIFLIICLHLCGISNLIACFIFLQKNKVLFEFLFYAGIIGGIQAF